MGKFLEKHFFSSITIPKILKFLDTNNCNTFLLHLNMFLEKLMHSSLHNHILKTIFIIIDDNKKKKILRDNQLIFLK